MFVVLPLFDTGWSVGLIGSQRVREGITIFECVMTYAGRNKLMGLLCIYALELRVENYIYELCDKVDKSSAGTGSVLLGSCSSETTLQHLSDKIVICHFKMFVLFTLTVV